MQTIAVRVDRQGLGWGAVLLDALCAQALARGAAQVLLEVRADDDAALALYARAGFDVIHTRRHYYADAADAVIMRAGLGTETASDPA